MTSLNAAVGFGSTTKIHLVLSKTSNHLCDTKEYDARSHLV